MEFSVVLKHSEISKYNQTMLRIQHETEKHDFPAIFLYIYKYIYFLYICVSGIWVNPDYRFLIQCIEAMLKGRMYSDIDIHVSVSLHI